MRSLEYITQSNVQKQMTKYGFVHKFHDLKYFELEYSFSLSLNTLLIEGHHQKNCRNDQFYHNSSYF